MLSTAVALRQPAEILPPLPALPEGTRRWTGDLPPTADLRPFFVKGTSLEPAIRANTWVLVDYSDRLPCDSFFLVELGGVPCVMRMQCLGSHVEVAFVNPTFTAGNYRGPASGVRVLGRVAYHLKPF